MLELYDTSAARLALVATSGVIFLCLEQVTAGLHALTHVPSGPATIEMPFLASFLLMVTLHELACAEGIVAGGRLLDFTGSAQEQVCRRIQGSGTR